MHFLDFLCTEQATVAPVATETSTPWYLWPNPLAAPGFRPVIFEHVWTHSRQVDQPRGRVPAPPNLPFKTPQVPSNRGYKARTGGTWGSRCISPFQQANILQDGYVPLGEVVNGPCYASLGDPRPLLYCKAFYYQSCNTTTRLLNLKISRVLLWAGF